jgi:hypothetical protein
VVYLVIAVLLSSGIAKCLRPMDRNRVSSQRSPIRAPTASTRILGDHA